MDSRFGSNQSAVVEIKSVRLIGFFVLCWEKKIDMRALLLVICHTFYFTVVIDTVLRGDGSSL